MLHVALFEPEIAGNAGNIARTCLAVGARLHLIRPLGFRLSDEGIKRAGLDYWKEAEVQVHASFTAFKKTFAGAFERDRVLAFTTKGNRLYTNFSYQEDDVLLFGPESRGLPEAIRAITLPLRIPMKPPARSLNLAVSAGVALYEAWRQLGFAG